MADSYRFVPARQGEWHCEKDASGHVLSYFGCFPAEEYANAQKTAAELKKKGITADLLPVIACGDSDYRPQFGDDMEYYMLRVPYDICDLRAFEAWEHFAELLPRRAEEINLSGQLLQANEAIEQEKRSVLKFKTLRPAQAEEMIRYLPKELVDVGHHHSWVVTTDVPEVALQAAICLHREAFIRDKDFKKLRDEAYHVMLGGEPRDFRIAINPLETERFVGMFICAPPLPPLSPRAIQFIVERSHGSAGRGLKVAG